MDYNNIFLLDCSVDVGLPNNFKNVEGEIIDILKSNNFSLSASALLFKRIINDLGNTPMNSL